MTISPSDYSISTPENVDLHLELAGCGNRILAGLIDKLLSFSMTIAVILLCLIAFQLVNTLQSNSALAKSILFTMIIIFLLFSTFIINFGYFIYFESSWRGQTPGKKFAGIRVIEQNGQPVSQSSAWIRNLLRIIDEGCFVIGLISMLVDKNERRIGDFAANTIVIRERLSQIPDTVVNRPADNFEYQHLDIGLITPQEYDLIAAFLRRRAKIEPGHRQRLAAKLEDYFASKLHATKHPESEQFLESLISAYLARAEI